MIRFEKGDLLEADVEALVNPVNCVGIMGKGLAYQFKRAWPENFRAYVDACDRGWVRPGQMFIFQTRDPVNPRYIINFPTKRHWRDVSRMEDIENGLFSLLYEVSARDIRSIAIPPLGCGLGGLKWPEVRGRIERAANALSEVDVIIFEPTD